MRLSIVVVSLLWCTSLAAAQPGEPPPSPPPSPPVEPPPPVVVAPAPVAVTPPTSTVDKGTLDDANAGRVAIMPTALTPPAGTWSFEDWELFFVSASYGVTDQLVITGTAMVPITSDLYWGFISAKYQLLKQDRLRFAVQGGLAGVLYKDTVDQFDSMGNLIGTMTSSQTTSGADLAGALTYCLDDDCYSHVDGAVVAGFAHQSSSAVPVGFMGGLVARVGKRVRLILEADTAHVFGDISGQANGFLGWYGLRFTSRQIGVDLALVKPFCNSGCTSDTLPLGFPFVTFAYRGLD